YTALRERVRSLFLGKVRMAIGWGSSEDELSDKRQRSRATAVAVVKTSDHWHRNHLALLGSFDPTRLGCVVLKRHWAAGDVVILEVAAEQFHQVSLAKDDDVIEQVPANRVNQALALAVNSTPQFSCPSGKHA